MKSPASRPRPSIARARGEAYDAAGTFKVCRANTAGAILHPKDRYRGARRAPSTIGVCPWHPTLI